MADIAGLLKNIRKDIGSTSFKDSKLSDITDWFDTGSFNLNRVISGSVYKGIPQGRVVMIGGESGSGKSILAARTIASALNGKVKHVFFFDSEGGTTKEMMTSQGINIDKIEHIPVESIEDCSVKIQQVFDTIKAHKKTNPDDQFYIVIDSIGNMVTEKFFTDAVEKDKQVTDMGLRARAMNTMLTGLCMPSLITNTGVLLINHIYDSTGDLHPSKIKAMPGGRKTQFIPHLTLQCSKRLVKNEGDDLGDEAFYEGNVLRFFSVKNRIARMGVEAECYIDFKTGVDRYHGLLDIAVKYGLIEQNGAFYKCREIFGDKSVRSKDVSSKEVMDKLLPIIDKKSIADMSYSKEELSQIIIEEETILSESEVE